MAGKTPRFGFNYFGSGTPGTMTDNAQKYTSLDRLTMDRLLESVEIHDHRYRPRLNPLSTPPSGVLIPSKGKLEAGLIYYYRFSLIDQRGRETLGSPELEVVTPALLPPPGMPSMTAATTSGTLETSYYYYALTAHRGGEESPLGQAAMISLTTGETSVRITMPNYGQATSFSVWRMGSNDAGFTRIGLVSKPGTTFTDTGAVKADPCACDPGVAPPVTNTGVAAYSVKVTLPTGVLTPQIRSWRLYRSVYAGIYNASSLVHEVVETEDEWDPDSPLLDEWTDTGKPLITGKPMDSDRNMNFVPFTFEAYPDTLPSAVGYPVNYPVLLDDTLYVANGTGWTPISGGGGGGGGTVGPAAPPILTAPDGSRWVLGVDAAGSLTTSSTVLPGPPTPPGDLAVY